MENIEVVGFFDASSPEYNGRCRSERGFSGEERGTRQDSSLSRVKFFLSYASAPCIQARPLNLLTGQEYIDIKSNSHQKNKFNAPAST